MAHRVTIAGLCLVVAASGLSAQTGHPKFEVASVKPHKDGPPRAPLFKGDRFSYTGPVLLLISLAYQVPFNPQSVRLSGGPEWIRSRRQDQYDIDAKGSFPAGLSSSARDERGRQMLQALLADRFKLVIRREAKEMPVYVLVVGKGGPKLEKSALSDKDCLQLETDGQLPCHQFNGGRGRGLHTPAANMDDLAGVVENWTDRPLLNKTGITGLYRIETQPWLPMEVSANPPAPGAKGEAGNDVADLPTVFQIFEKLGLKMKADKGEVDTYVIESIQRPTGN